MKANNFQSKYICKINYVCMTEYNECIYTYYSSSHCNTKLLLLFRVNRTLYHL